MASSSIEVMGMGGNDVKVMLLEDTPHDEEMAKRMQDIIHQTGPPGHIIDTGNPLGTQGPTGQDEDFTTMGQFPTIGGMEPPPGTIIFSPQDLLRPSKPATRGRGRGRSALSAVKNEPCNSTQLGGNQSLEVPVACEICGKVMMTGKTLVQHMAIHSDLKPFQCPHCPKSFARKVHLQGHLVVHGIEKQFECPVCHQRFSRQDCVKVHMRLHDKSKCVYCDVCHKAFLTVGALNIHLRIHRGEKPFKCHLCSKCFTQKNHLITHIKRHTKVTDEHFTKRLGPRMFKCEHCPRAFIRLSDYERHVQWNHGAVAEGSIIDKLPTVSNLLDGEMKQTGLAPQIFKAPKDALNSNKHHKYRRGKKVMCSASTQTDEDGGHVIIPRMYQTSVSASTQVSAPPTPRPADDDMYGDDIFDEGMDRNYSSDEDEDDPTEMESPEVKRIYTVAGTSDMASDPVQDAAFDAIVQGASSKPSNTVDVGGGESTNDQHAVFLQEVVSSMTKQGLDDREPDREEEEKLSLEGERMEIIENENDEIRTHESTDDSLPHHELIAVHPEELVEGQPQKEMSTMEELPYFDDEASFHFSTSLRGKSKPGRPRGRGRGSRGRKHWQGLTGAAELRAMRKTMMISILNANEKEFENTGGEAGGLKNDAAEDGKVVTTDTTTDEVETEGRVKRMAKKQHGKDFVCNMKNCETCLPSQKPNSKVQTKIKVKVREKDSEDTEVVPVKKILSLPAYQNRSPRPMAKQIVSTGMRESPKPVGKHIVSTIQRESPKPVAKETLKISSENSSWVSTGLHSPSLHRLKERVLYSPEAKKLKTEKADSKLDRSEEAKMKVGNRVGTYPVDITANPLVNKTQKQDYFVTTSKSDSIVSPPVELMSFCIPTYSCKLCGREFRFEGKLHRHIESVHQNKPIFSADVKPGRGSSKYATGGGGSISRVTKIDEIQMPPPVLETENPEIAALRSEWDDDDDDDDDMGDTTISVSAAGTTVPTVTTYTTHQPMTIVTRDIAPVTTTITDSQSYSSGVKVNMNKLAGLLPPGKSIPVTCDSIIKQDSDIRISTTVAPTHHPREPITIMADTLDMKCRRLLEKLFSHDLLLKCGLLEEHISVVLGRVLQHYGVKMIEDYGQGQYEVLKYNLWRLIEWKVTMEQMEEFYTAGKSVEEMMDDIMNERVPLVSHHFVPHEQKAHPPPQVSVSQAGQVTQVEAMEVTDGQMVLQQVAGVLGGQINLPEGVTQVVLAQDVSPDLLQGAHIVTIDPTTGQVISQVTADQVILTDAIGDELEQQVAALDGQVVVSHAHIVNQNVTHESIVVPQSQAITVHGGQGQMSHGQMVVHAAPHQQSVKLETTSHNSAQQHHHHHHHHQQ